MTPPQSTGRMIFSQLAWACLRVLGGTALLTAVWESVRLAGGLAGHLNSGAAWLDTLLIITLIVLWAAAGTDLLRGRTTGWFTLCTLTCFSILSCGFQPATFLHPWLCLWFGPLPFAADEFLAEPLALLFLFLLIVAGLGLYFARPPGPPVSGWIWTRRVALVPALALLFAGWWRAQESLDLAACDLIYQAWSSSREKKDDTEVILGRVMAEFPFTMAWCEAVLTDAHQRQSRGEYYEAIQSYQTVLGSRLGDCTPAPRLFVRRRNDRNFACIGLAECYESLGDYRQALRYARLAEAAHRPHSWCGTCNECVRREVAERVGRLQVLLE